MFKLLTLLCALAVCHGRNLENIDDINGSYYLVYSWPKLEENRPSCTKVHYKESVVDEPVSCQCKNSDSAVQPVRVELLDLKFDVISKVIDNVDDLAESVNDDCVCSSGRTRDVIVRIDDDYLLHYVQFDKTVFLLSKVVPSAERRQEITDLVSQLLKRDGNLLCQ